MKNNNMTENDINKLEDDLTQDKELNSQLETNILPIEDIPEDQILD
jgi:hypothetical protein